MSLTCRPIRNHILSFYFHAATMNFMSEGDEECLKGSPARDTKKLIVLVGGCYNFPIQVERGPMWLKIEDLIVQFLPPNQRECRHPCFESNHSKFFLSHFIEALMDKFPAVQRSTFVATKGPCGISRPLVSSTALIVCRWKLTYLKLLIPFGTNRNDLLLVLGQNAACLRKIELNDIKPVFTEKLKKSVESVTLCGRFSSVEFLQEMSKVETVHYEDHCSTCNLQWSLPRSVSEFLVRGPLLHFANVHDFISKLTFEIAAPPCDDYWTTFATATTLRFPNLRVLSLSYKGETPIQMNDRKLCILGVLDALESLKIENFGGFTGRFISNSRFESIRAIEFRNCPDVSMEIRTYMRDMRPGVDLTVV